MATLQIGNGNWAVKEDALLGYNINDYDGKYYPRDIAWTRGSDAWRTNADGLIQRMPWNLASYSNDFTNATWLKDFVTVNSNTTISPDGIQNASTITTTSTSHSLREPISVVAGNTYTFSFYALRGTMTDLKYSVYNITGASNIIAPTSYYSQTNSSTWSRISVTFTAPVGCVSAWVFPVRDSGVTGTFFIYGAQLVKGSSALDYFPTTDRLNVPRVDYTYTTTGAMLLEPQRTNQMANSGWVGGATPTGWTLFSTGSVTSSTSTKNTSVNSLTFSGTSQRAFVIYSSFIFTSGVTYSMSVYVESVTTPANVDTIIGIANLPYSSTGFLKNNIAISGSTLIEAGNTYTLVFTPSATQFGDCRIGLGVGGNITANYRLSMPQLEQGAYATTFILSPTTASATRVADTFTRSNIFTNGYISSAGGTWYVELVNNIPYTRDAGNSNLFIGDTASNFPSNSLEIRNGGVANSRLDLGKRISGTFTTLYTTTTSTTKIAFKWNGSSVDVFVNGTKQVSASSFSITNMEFLYSQIQDVPRYIPWMTLYSTPLSDAECALITTL